MYWGLLRERFLQVRTRVSAGKHPRHITEHEIHRIHTWAAAEDWLLMHRLHNCDEARSRINRPPWKGLDCIDPDGPHLGSRTGDG